MNENLKHHFEIKCSGKTHTIGITANGDLFFDHPDIDLEKIYVEMMKNGNPKWSYDFQKSPCLAYLAHLSALKYEQPTDKKYKNRVENYVKQMASI